MNKRRQVSGVVVAIVVVATATAGQAATTAYAADRTVTAATVRQAASKTLAAKSERVEIDEATPLLSLKTTKHQTALVSRARNESSVTTRTGTTLPGSGLDNDLSAGGDPREQRYIDGDSYIDFGSVPSSPGLPAGKHSRPRRTAPTVCDSSTARAGSGRRPRWSRCSS
jgi:hypothetical protein